MSGRRSLASWILGGMAIGVALRTLLTSQQPPRAAGDEPEPAAAMTLAAPLVENGIAVAREGTGARIETAWHIARLVLHRLRVHTTTVIAGSLAYYALLAVFPAAIAAISIYGLVADPADLTSLIENLAERLPADTTSTIQTELESIVGASGTGLGLGAAIGIAAALWSASAGAKVLITGVNLAYGERETRSFLVVRGLGLLLTLGMISGTVIVVAGVAILPSLVDSVVADLVRWPALILLVVAGLATLYRIAPADALGRAHPVWQGAFAAAVAWLAATAAFSAAVSRFGDFSATYGALAGVVLLLIWFFLSGLIVLLGAEFNAAIETRRRRVATTTG